MRSEFTSLDLLRNSAGSGVSLGGRTLRSAQCFAAYCCNFPSGLMAPFKPMEQNAATLCALSSFVAFTNGLVSELIPRLGAGSGLVSPPLSQTGDLEADDNVDLDSPKSVPRVKRSKPPIFGKKREIPKKSAKNRVCRAPRHILKEFPRAVAFLWALEDPTPYSCPDFREYHPVPEITNQRLHTVVKKCVLVHNIYSRSGNRSTETITTDGEKVGKNGADFYHPNGTLVNRLSCAGLRVCDIIKFFTNSKSPPSFPTTSKTSLTIATYSDDSDSSTVFPESSDALRESPAIRTDR